MSYAEKSVGLTDGTYAGREAVKWYAEQILKLDEQLAVIESPLHEKCREIPYAENILEIKGVGENILAGILAEMGDISSVQTPIPFRLLNFRIASPSDICQTASRLNAPL